MLDRRGLAICRPAAAADLLFRCGISYVKLNLPAREFWEKVKETAVERSKDEYCDTLFFLLPKINIFREGSLKTRGTSATDFDHS